MKLKYRFKIIQIVVLLLIFFIFVTGCSRSAVSPTATLIVTPNKLQPYCPDYNVGSSKKLLGKCLFINIFIWDGVSSFSEDNKTRCLDSLDQAINFLLKKAKEYNCSFEPIYNQPDITLDYTADFTLPSTFGNYNWAKKIVEDILENHDLKHVLETYQADNVSYIFNVHKQGHMYALPKGTISGYDNEIAVLMGVPSIVSKEPIGADGMVYAHEILHLFGAIDLYYRFDTDDTRNNLTKEQFRFDIMRNPGSYPIDKTELCDIDAYLIGWLEELAEQYHMFLD